MNDRPTATEARRRYVIQPTHDTTNTPGQTVPNDLSIVSGPDPFQDKNVCEPDENASGSMESRAIGNGQVRKDWSAKSHLEKITDGWDGDAITEMERKLDKVWEMSGMNEQE